MPMNTKLIPEAAQTSYGMAFKLNAWAIVAILIAAAGRWGAESHAADPLTRAALALLPMIPSALYMRTIVHWIRTLDELQRRIQQEAWFFATAGTIIVLTALNALAPSSLLAGTGATHGLGWEGTYALALCLWMTGCVVSNRGYR